MIATIARYFGWDRLRSRPASPQPRHRPAHTRPVTDGAGQGKRRGAGPVGSAEDAKAKAEGKAEGSEPAMAVIPDRDEVQRMPVASPGLPPVDPEEGTIPPSTIGFAASRPHAAFEGVDERARETESGPPGEPYLPFDSLPSIDSTGRHKRDESDIPCQVVAPCDDLDLGAFLDAVAGNEGSSIAECKDRCASGTERQGMVFSDAPTMPCEHSVPWPVHIETKDRLGPDADDFRPIESGQPWSSATVAVAFDSRIETGLPSVTTPARDIPRLPRRVADRPRSEEWNDDELLTLPEAAALFWPAGPITTNTLRTAGRDGSLAITKVAGKFFTTPMAIRRMGADGGTDKVKQAVADEASAYPTLHMKIAEAQRLGGGRARSRRAAKRPVATAVIGGSGQ